MSIHKSTEFCCRFALFGHASFLWEKVERMRVNYGDFQAPFLDLHSCHNLVVAHILSLWWRFTLRENPTTIKIQWDGDWRVGRGAATSLLELMMESIEIQSIVKSFCPFLQKFMRFYDASKKLSLNRAATEFWFLIAFLNQIRGWVPEQLFLAQRNSRRLASSIMK